MSYFLDPLPPQERLVLQSLLTPAEIQKYLDTLVYPSSGENRSVLRAMREGQAHCLDGGVVGAAALCALGYAPVIIDLRAEPEIDDDHVLAIYRADGGWGCVAKSNFPLLRSRSPVYRSVRELVMSYFEVYLNIDNRRLTLRSYTSPLDLSRPGRALRGLNPLLDDRSIDHLEAHLAQRKRTLLTTPAQIRHLRPADDWLFDATIYGVQNWDGVFHSDGFEP